MLDEQLTINGQGGYVLLASCAGDDTGGGLFAFDGRAVEAIDRLSSSGIYADGDQFLRVLWNPSDLDSIAELLVYDAQGVKRYHRLDSLSGVHEILWD